MWKKLNKTEVGKLRPPGRIRSAREYYAARRHVNVAIL